MKRVLVPAVLGASFFLACTFTRSLDYLTNGGPDAGPDTDATQQEAGSSSSSSGSTEAGPTVGDVVAQNQYDPANLVQDADHLYWTTDDNQVMKLAKAGGDPVQLTKLTGDVNQIMQAVVDVSPTGNVYLLLASGVKKVPKAGGAATDFVATTTAYEIAADDTSVFLLNELDPENTDTAQLVRYAVSAPGTPVILSAVGTAPTALTLTTDTVYWTVSDDNGDYVALSLPKTAAAGATPTTYKNNAQDTGTAIGIDPTDATEILVDGTTLFWLDDNESAAYKESLAPPATQATTLITAKNQSTFYAIAVDTTSVYLTPSGESDTNTLVRLPKTGGPPDTLTVQPNPGEIQADDKAVYVAFAGPGDVPTTNGGILKITK